MKRILAKLKNRGAAAIEFALVAPLLFFLLFGILEFGLTLTIDSTMNNALRSVARQSIVTPYTTADQVRTQMDYYMQNFARPNTYVVMCTYPNVAAMRSLTLDPGLLFSAPPSYNAGTRSGCVTGASTILAANQINSILVFASRYDWGGITQMFAGMIPNHLYAVTIVRSEYRE